MINYGTCFGIGYYPYGGWMMLFWLIVLIIIAYLIWKYTKEGSFAFSINSLEILKRRYAKGEITKKQFEEMKKNLK